MDSYAQPLGYGHDQAPNSGSPCWQAVQELSVHRIRAPHDRRVPCAAVRC